MSTELKDPLPPERMLDYAHGEQAMRPAVAECVRPIHFGLLLVILLGGTLLRVHSLGKTSYWYDELSSVLYARGETNVIFTVPLGYFEKAPAYASAPGMRRWRDIWFGFDTTPPLYPTLLRIWWQFFGEGDIAGRALSVTFSVLTIAALFDVGRLMLSPAAALWACAVCAASPPMVRYAQEARAYALLCLMGVLICDIALRVSLFGGSRRRYLLLWLCCAAALLTHYFIVGGIAAVAAFGIFSLRGRTRIAFVVVIATAFLVELWVVPILLHHGQDLHQGIDWTSEPREGLLLNTLLRIAWLPIVYLILPPEDPGLLFVPAIVLLLLPILLRKQRPGLMLAGLWSLGVIGLVAASDLWLGHGALVYSRYTLAAAPMVFISFAAICEMGGKVFRHVLPALTVAGALLAVPEAYSSQAWIKPETRQLAQDVQSQVRAGDVLVIGSHAKMGLEAAGLDYLGIDFYAGPLPCALAILEAPADDATRQLIWSHKHVWLVRGFDGLVPGSAFDPSGYLGPCRLTPAGNMHLFAGRLYSAELVKKSTE